MSTPDVGRQARVAENHGERATASGELSFLKLAQTRIPPLFETENAVTAVKLFLGGLLTLATSIILLDLLEHRGLVNELGVAIGELVVAGCLAIPGFLVAQRLKGSRVVQLCLAASVLFVLLFFLLELIESMDARILAAAGAAATHSVLRHLSLIGAAASLFLMATIFLGRLEAARSQLLVEQDRTASVLEKQTVVEQALRESEVKFRSLAESTAAMICILQRSRVVYANSAVERALALDPTSLDATDFLSLFTESSRVKIAGIMAAWRDGSSLPGQVELELAAQGERPPITVEVATTAIDFDGRRAVLATAFDITDRKRTVEALATTGRFLESVARGTPLAETLSSLVRQVERLLPGSTAVAVRVSEEDKGGSPHVYGDPSENLVEAIREADQHPDGSTQSRPLKLLEQLEPACRRHGLETTWASPVLDPEGRSIGLFSIHWSGKRTATDVDLQILEQASKLTGIAIEQKRETAERRRLAARLEAAQRIESLGALAGGMAHDFNNLMTGVLGSASLLRSQFGPDSPFDESLERIETAAERVSLLCDQILAFAGRTPILSRQEDLSSLVTDLQERLRLVVGRQARLELRLADDLPVVELDPRLIRETIVSLVTNAVEASDPESGPIEVETGVLSGRRRDEDIGDGAYAYVRVRDHGSGMDAATQARIFEPFFTTKFLGRGLGLSAALGVVRSHGGALRVESEPGEGSTFTLLLPLRATAEEPATEIGVAAHRILIVDNEELVATLAGQTLRREGYQIDFATDGDEALSLLRQDPFDLVLLELNLPGRSGAEVLRILKEEKPQLPVILCSTLSREQTPWLAQTEPNALLRKPYRPGQLISLVEEQLSASGETSQLPLGHLG